MSSQSFTAVLLLLSGNTEGLPWDTPPWQALTKIHGLPWITEESASEDASSSIISEWTVCIAWSVQSFAETVWQKQSEDGQNRYITKKKIINNDTTGCNAWQKWVSLNQKTWGLNAVIDDTLSAAGRTPQQVLRELETKKLMFFICGYILPTAEEAQIYDLQLQLGEKLFGNAAYQGSSLILKSAVGKFTQMLLTLSWNRYHKTISREHVKMTTVLAEVKETWKALTSEGAQPTSIKIKAFMKDLRRLLALLNKYEDAQSKALVDGYMADMEAMLVVICHEPGSEESNKLPKALQDALSNLASEEDILAISQDILALLENIQAADGSERVDVDLEEHLSIKEWREEGDKCAFMPYAEMHGKG
ncbi:hypothetical protein BU15DRAFT_63908 [Melanogaster broomeanus]|nr:hypothetical protein BU15DRAFT_63908 [Melanogaster broomeanus]